MTCPECSRPAKRLKRGVCCACYGRRRYRAARPRAVAPCALCGEEGPKSPLGVPIRCDGETWGIDGWLCKRCSASFESAARGNYGYRIRRFTA